MKIRTFAASLAVAALATLSLAGIASAQPGDRDCPDFATQGEAQAALDSQSGDPERLDRDKDRIACEDTFGEPAAASTGNDEDDSDEESSGDERQVTVVPQGSVDTGDGSTTTDPTPALLLLGGLGALGTAAVARRAVRG